MDSTQKQLCAQAVELIERDFPMLAGVDDLADRLAVSKCHLIRCFSSQMGISPGKYLTGIRLAAVQEHLTQSDHNLDTIAGLTGFACGNYLCKVFRKAFGISPMDYRQQHRGSLGDSAQLRRRSEDISFV